MSITSFTVSQEYQEVSSEDCTVFNESLDYGIRVTYKDSLPSPGIIDYIVIPPGGNISKINGHPSGNVYVRCDQEHGTFTREGKIKVTFGYDSSSISDKLDSALTLLSQIENNTEDD